MKNFAVKPIYRFVLLLCAFAVLVPAADVIRPLTILHTNDLHARLLPRQRHHQQPHRPCRNPNPDQS